MNTKVIAECIDKRKNLLKSSPFDKYRFQFIKMILQKEPRDSYILDIGCNIGILGEYYKTLGSKVTYIDIDNFFIKCARANNFNFNIEQSFICASLENIPVKDSFFDIIIVSEVIEHLPIEKHRQALEEILRVAKTNSTIAITTPNRFSLPGLEGRFIELFVNGYKWVAWDETHHYIYSSWEFVHFLKSNKKLKIDKIYGFYFLSGSLIVRMPVFMQDVLGYLSFLVSKYLGAFLPLRYLGFTTMVILRKHSAGADNA